MRTASTATLCPGVGGRGSVVIEILRALSVDVDVVPVIGVAAAVVAVVVVVSTLAVSSETFVVLLSGSFFVDIHNLSSIYHISLGNHRY